jgi:hypothetical protein
MLLPVVAPTAGSDQSKLPEPPPVPVWVLWNPWGIAEATGTGVDIPETAGSDVRQQEGLCW